MKEWHWKIDRKSLLAGGIVIIFGLAVASTSIGYGIGTARRMDTGYYPMLLGFAAIIIGIGILLFEAVGRAPVIASPEAPEQDSGTGLMHGDRHRKPLSGLQMRAIILVSLSIAVFALMLERIGLVPATISLILVSGLAAPQPRLGRLALIAVLAPVGLWLAFVEGLGLPFRLF